MSVKNNELSVSGCKHKLILLSVWVCVCLQTSSTELLQKVCEMARRGLIALAKGIATLLPPDSSAITDSVFMQVGSHSVPHLCKRVCECC